MEEALVVDLHQIAGAEPGVAVGEDIAQDLLLGFAGLGIALEAAAAFIGNSNAADRFADLAARTGNAKPLRVAQGLAAVSIDRDDSGGKAMREQRRDAPDRARSALDVEEREILMLAAFGRPVVPEV
jgi:hypothetical protein